MTIAECLESAAHNNVSIPDAMKAYELLRYNRTVATMKLGEEVRNVPPKHPFRTPSPVIALASLTRFDDL